MVLALTKHNHFVPFSLGVSWLTVAQKLLAEAGSVKDFDSGRGSQLWDRLFFYYNKVLIYYFHFKAFKNFNIMYNKILPGVTGTDSEKPS